MDSEQLSRHFGTESLATTTIGVLFEDNDPNKPVGVIYEIAVRGASKDVEWQKVYRQIAETLLKDIPALEAAGVK